MGGVAALGVLGPLLLEGDAGPIRIGSSRQRRLLAALAAHLGRAVEVGQLVDLVWADDLPADPAGAVQTNVARLRRLLPDGIRLTTTPEGYRLEADRAIVDVTAFADHLAAAAALGDPVARRDRLGAGLALWRGHPYAELDHPTLAPAVARLAELHAGAAEQHAEALLAAGCTAEATAELEALIAAEPLREGAVALLMQALVAAGRQGDALAAFARLRARLADELGMDPSPRLCELEQRVLRQDLPTASVAPVPRTVSRPRLPVSSFIGRDATMAHAGALLERHRIVTLCGPGGVGKTRLALHVAAAVASRYGDGALVVEFGEGGRDDVEPMLAAALRMSDTGPTESFAERVTALLAVRHQLLLFDNCEHVADRIAELVEAVSAGTPRVDLLLTSREPLRVDGERVLGVEPLAPDAAAELLVDRMSAADPDPDGPQRIAPELVAEVCRRLDGLPLALELAAARAASLGLRALLRELDDPSTAAQRPAHGDGAAPVPARRRRVVLRPARRRAAGLFERLSVFAGPVEYAAVEAVCGDAAALPDLVDRSLVVRRPGDPQSFGLLETLRAFGRSRLAGIPRPTACGPGTRPGRPGWPTRSPRPPRPRRARGIRRFDLHLAELRRAHAWLCVHGPLDELLRLTVPIAELSVLQGRADLVVLLEETLRAGVLGPEPVHPPALPLVARLLGYHAHTLWQRGDLDTGERQAGGPWNSPRRRASPLPAGTRRRRWPTCSGSAATSWRPVSMASSRAGHRGRRS